MALVDWVLDVAKIPPERIVLLGQSLGTAVASATALRYADPDHDLFLAASISKRDETTALLRTVSKTPREPTTFASVVLVAPFSSLPSLLLTYRIGGLFPVLLPLRPFPTLANFLTSQMIDKWPTADRLAAYYATTAANPPMRFTDERNMGRLEIIHAINDADISYKQTEMICRRIFAGDDRNESKCLDGSSGASMLEVKEEGKVKVRLEILVHGGKAKIIPSANCQTISLPAEVSLKVDELCADNSTGHNRIVTYTPVAAAVLRAFEDLN